MRILAIDLGKFKSDHLRVFTSSDNSFHDCSHSRLLSVTAMSSFLSSAVPRGHEDTPAGVVGGFEPDVEGTLSAQI